MQYLMLAYLLLAATATLADDSLRFFGIATAPVDWSDDSDLADDVWQYFASSNFQYPLKPGDDPATAHRSYRDAVRGPHIVVTFDTPKLLSINGNRNVIRDIRVSELVMGLDPESLFPNRLFGIASDGAMVAFHKFRGDLGLELQKTLQAKTAANASQEATGGPPGPQR